MPLDHLIAKARDHFNIETPDDWCKVRPEWVRLVPGCGPKTLDLIRLYLAARGLTLKDDATPDFWNRNLQTAMIGGQLSLVDTAKTEAFTILIDSQEKQPWTFQGFKDKGTPLICPIKFQSLGPSHGDYSVAGHEDTIHIERKSIEDALGTFLSHGERRERWGRTLDYLASIPHGHVVVEGTIFQCFAAVNPRGSRSKSALCNELIGSIQSWSDLRIPFWFIDSRRLAEGWARRLMRRAWMHESGLRKKQITTDIDAVIDAL